MQWDAVDTEPLGFLVAPNTVRILLGVPSSMHLLQPASADRDAGVHHAQVDGFLGQHWEKLPGHFKATPERKQLFKGLFGYGEFEALVKAQAEQGA